MHAESAKCCDVAIFGFAVVFGRYFNKNCGPRSVPVFAVAVFSIIVASDMLTD